MVLGNGALREIVERRALVGVDTVVRARLFRGGALGWGCRAVVWDWGYGAQAVCEGCGCIAASIGRFDLGARR